jgi:SAM-dependent methyltransferase
MNSKTGTDRYWDQRALDESDDAKVNIADTVQRDHELDFVVKHIGPGSKIVEVGCGNGYATRRLREHAGFVDAFDYAQNMVERAKDKVGEKNNRFFHDSILAPKIALGPYDAAVCVRVLINLSDLAAQKLAVRNLAAMLKPGGTLILIEGFRDGFEALSALRQGAGMPPLQPAPINFYCSLSELMPEISDRFVIQDTFHTGLFDFLTRIVYPKLVGPENAAGPGDFHSKIEPIIKQHAGPDLVRYARLHGFALSRR